MDRYQSVVKAITDFNAARDWGQFHQPKDVSMAIAIEASELMQVFLWKKELGKSDIPRISEEIGDIGIFLTTLSNRLGLDLLDCMEAKIRLNEQKYPVEKSRGSAKKYNEL